MLANVVVETFLKGGWVMWPILATFFLALCTVLDRTVWWLRYRATLDPAGQEQARVAIGTVLGFTSGFAHLRGWRHHGAHARSWCDHGHRPPGSPAPASP